MTPSVQKAPAGWENTMAVVVVVVVVRNKSQKYYSLARSPCVCRGRRILTAGYWLGAAVLFPNALPLAQPGSADIYICTVDGLISLIGLVFFCAGKGPINGVVSTGFPAEHCRVWQTASKASMKPP